MKYPKGIKAVYEIDDGSLDRFTVYFSNRKDYGMDTTSKMWPCIGMNATPYHPQGIGQHGSGMLGKHNGKLIPFESLPKDCQHLALFNAL